MTETKYFPVQDIYIICVTNTDGPNGGSYFVDNIQWELLEKKAYETVALDFDLQEIEGTYSGQTRERTQDVEVKELANGITMEFNQDGKIDTLSTYIGNHTWMNGNTSIRIKDGVSRKD